MAAPLPFVYGEREIFHEGELAIQRRAGVAESAGRVGEANLLGQLPPEFAAFLSQMFFVAVGSVALDGGVWASLLTGQPGFIRVTDATHLELSAEPLGRRPAGRDAGRRCDPGGAAGD
jgi:predicted pyridoxine 5'-phosphate oxidase superfamily flavin-nucleotide-binding protein